eukprot:scaffold41473_cov219-Skeletonema_marinoi.AAC.3
MTRMRDGPRVPSIHHIYLTYPSLYFLTSVVSIPSIQSRYISSPTQFVIVRHRHINNPPSKSSPSGIHSDTGFDNERTSIHNGYYTEQLNRQ